MLPENSTLVCRIVKSHVGGAHILSHWTTRHHQAPSSESLSDSTSTTFEFRAHGLLKIHSHLLVFNCDSKLEKV